MNYYYYPKTTAELISSIQTANGIGGANTFFINLSSKLYLLTTVQDTGDTSGASGLPAITSNIHIIGNGAILMRADNAPLFRILRIAAGVTNALIQGVTISNGQLGALGHGAGLKTQSNLEIRNTVFRDNQAGDQNGGYGGAIFNGGTTMRIFDSEISYNVSTSEGGGIYNDIDQNVLLENTIVRSNQSPQGGGIHSRGDLVRADDCYFESNKSQDGGAIRLTGGGALIRRCTINDNKADNSGAALYMLYHYPFTTVTFEDCRIFGNVSQNKQVFDFYNDNTPITVDALNNYWGAQDGPSGQFPGSGDSVSSGVDVFPYTSSDEVPQDPGAGDDDLTCQIPSDNTINPIGLREGEKRVIETDIQVETPSGALAFKRFYRQSKQFDTRFQFMGLGWTHNHHYDLELSGSAPDRTASIGTPSGGQLLLTEISQDIFAAEAGAYATLQITGGQYLLAQPDGTLYTFNSSFEMISRQMPNQEVWTYTYSGGLLVGVEDDYGRGLQFAYDSGLLVRVGDHDANLTPGSLSGRYVEFEYQNAKAKSTSEGDILATDQLLHKVYDVHQAAKPTIDKDPWIYVYYGQDSSETDTAQYNWLIERISPSPEASTTPITLEKLSYLADQDAVIATQTLVDPTMSTEFNLVPGRAYLVEAEVEVISGTVELSVTGTSDFDVLSSGTGTQTLSKSVSAYSAGDTTRRHEVMIVEAGSANFTVQSITVTETDPEYHTLVQERGVDGTSNPLETNQIVVQPNGRNETETLRAGQTTIHIFDRGLRVGRDVLLASGETLSSRTRLNTQFRSDVQEDARGNSTRLSWSEDGRTLDEVTDALNNKTQFSYDTQERLIQSIDAEGHIRDYTYDEVTYPDLRQPAEITVKDTDGTTVLRHQAFEYDSKGRTTKEQILDPDNETVILQETVRTYGTSGNSSGLLESLTVKDLADPSNDVSTSYTYDSVGRVIKVQKSSMFGSCDTSYTVYDVAGQVVASICNYDPGTNPAPTTAAEAAALYALVGDIDKNHVTTHTYDALGRRVATTTNAGTSFAKTSRTIYDALGRMVRTIQNYVPQGSSAPGDWVWVMDHWEDGANNTISHGSDLTENIVSDVAYNAHGLVRLRQDVLGNVTLFGYDDADRLVKTVQNAATASYDNDTSGDIDLSAYIENASLADQDIITVQTYDAAGNLVKSQDAAGRVTLMGLDALNRPVRVIRNASQPTYDIAVDPMLATYILSTDPDTDQINTTEYDSLGRVVRTQTLLENRDVEIWDTTLYGYDALGRQIKTIQHASTPDYNLVTDPSLSSYSLSNAADEDIVSETVYDAQGRVLYTQDVDGNKNWQVYDGLNRAVKSIQNASYVSGSPAPEDASYLGDLNAADADIISQTTFDNDGRVQKVQRVLQTNGAGTDLDWLYTLYGYDALGRQIKSIQNASDPDGTYAQDLSDYTPSSASDEDILSETVYDTQGRVLKTIDTRGNVTLYGYDSIGRRIKSIQNASNPTGTYAQDLSDYTPDVNAEIDQDRITQTVYDLAGRVEQTIDAANRVTLSIFDKLGRRVRTVSNYAAQGTSDPADWVWITDHWEDGASNTISHGDTASDNDHNVISDTVYNKAGQVASTRDLHGTVTGFVYDAAGRRIQTLRAQGHATLETTDYTCYDKAGRVLRTFRNWIDDATSPDAWDAQGDWVFAPSTHGTNNDENLITEFSYDQAGRRISTTNAAGDTSLTTYFKNGQVETMTDPEGTITLYRYDNLRRRTLVVQGYVTQGTSDPADWVWETGAWKQAPGGTVIQHGTHNDENIIVQIAYDKSGRQLSLRDPNGNEMTYEYDKLSRRTKLINPATTEWITAYANNGQKSSVTMIYPGLSTGGTYDVQHDFDRLGRLASIQYGDPASTPDVQFTYDAAGNRVEMNEFAGAGFTSPVRQTQYAYDDRNRLTEVGFDSDGDTVVEESVSYTYDLAGRRSELILPDGAGGTLSVTYTYDDLGRLETLTDWDNTAGNTFAYDEVDRHIQTVRPNGLISDYDYDLAGRLLNLKHHDGTTTQAEFSYLVDGRGNRVQASERMMKPDTSIVAKTIVYDYDALSRLISAQYHDGFNLPGGTVLDTYSYGYDRAGNLVNKDGVTRTYNTLNQMTNDGTHALTYDANGNLVSVGSETYGWDLANRMIAAPGSTSYKYDGLGNRLQQTVDSVVTDYLNDVQPGLTQMIAATTGSNTEYFVHGPRGIHAHALSGPGGNGAVWGQSIWGQSVWGDTGSGGTPEWQYLLQDGLGSVRAETDANADILANGGYDPYGLPIDLNGSFDSPFGFTGEQTDGNDQVYLRARYYAPDMGIFTALDPWEGIPQRPMSLNGYLFVEGDPIIRVDWGGDRSYDILEAEQKKVLAPIVWLYFYHGTSWKSVQGIISQGIVSEYAKGDFGQGFYTHHYPADNTLAYSSALSWALRNYKEDLGVLEIQVKESDYELLSNLAPNLTIDFNLTSRDQHDYVERQESWIKFIITYGRLPEPYYRPERGEWSLYLRGTNNEPAPNSGCNLIIGPFFGPLKGTEDNPPDLSEFEPIIPYETPDGRYPQQYLWGNAGIDLLNDGSKVRWTACQHDEKGTLTYCEPVHPPAYSQREIYINS